VSDRLDDQQAVDAAHEAVDPDRLLPGEDPESRLLEDAVHWRSVYQELLDAKNSIVDLTRSQLQSTSEVPVREELSNDQKIMLSELRRLQRRLRFWEDRAAGLGGG
jgi:hypothetical protein